MANCTLSKNKNYPIQSIVFNPVDKSYRLTLAEKTPSCAEGVFSSKKLEVKVIAANKNPVLHFNKQDNAPELVVNNLSLIKHQSSVNSETGVTPISHPQPSVPHFSFLYIILGIVVVILLVKFIFKRKNEAITPYPGSNNPNNMFNNGDNNNPNNPNFPNNSYNNQNNGQMGQPPSRTSSFLTGLAGGAVGAVVANSLYDKFKGTDAHASPQENPNDSFSSDDSANYNDDSGFSDDSFSDD